ncbi:hypothetical protein C8A01DRAFT_50912 [Parachaetomium inaequale]|uniref:F-box domain-containing protein n=1 Tax=Parachaetomium inaequale TaxID=2588326 RepID=A0AAN6P7P1_9PEZI|nr:hypothetical protein C8A01DRAFT_50912 [Parachaetomium inaequale]
MAHLPRLALTLPPTGAARGVLHPGRRPRAAFRALPAPLPTDIVLYLHREHLPPATAVALSLTCKALFGLVFPTAAPGFSRDPLERQALQLLLERDLGQHWWYCHGCSLLHRIRSQGPTGGVHDSSSRRVIIWNPRRPHHNSHFLDGSSFVLDYESVRLVMNRHFLGSPNGLPLESFDVEASSTVFNPWQGRLLPWRERWSARILQDELFLSATSTLSSAGWADETFRAALDHEWRQVCGHVRTSSALPYHTVTALRHPSREYAGFFAPCRDFVEACGQCLTDYATTVERRRGDAKQPTESWFITVTSYYQLGSGRSPTDAKWEAFGHRTTVSSYFTKRDFVAHPPGAVKAVWDSYKPWS